MPSNWDDPKIYRGRAQEWRDAAAKLPPGPTKDVSIVISEGYAKLAELIERDKAGQL
jgi:hypothetical protein